MVNDTISNDNPASVPAQPAIGTGTPHHPRRWPRLSPFVALLPGITVSSDDAAYPGGKGAVYQKIINQIPPHRVYIETHAGGGAILRHKRPAAINIAIDLDPDPLAALRSGLVTPDDIAGHCDQPGYGVTAPGAVTRQVTPDDVTGQRRDVTGLGHNTVTHRGVTQWAFINEDAVNWLGEFAFSGDEFIYADPPYLMESRKQQRPLYRYEYTEQDHINLLNRLQALPCPVMISGYHSALYTEMLAGWRVDSFQTRTRGGSWAIEYLWMNYPAPERLHDYRYLGDNYRERERIKRKKERWAQKWAKMPLLERQAILAAMQEAGE